MASGCSAVDPADPTSGLPTGAVARIWHGTTLAAKSEEYLRLMRTVALPDYRATPGNLGAVALQRTQGELAHFLMLTCWESEAAIARFAGEPIEAAKYYDFDTGFLQEKEPTATHYRLFDR